MFLDSTPASMDHNYLMNHYKNNNTNLCDNVSVFYSFDKKNNSSFLSEGSSIEMPFYYYRTIDLKFNLIKILTRSSNDNLYVNDLNSNLGYYNYEYHLGKN